MREVMENRIGFEEAVARIELRTGISNARALLKEAIMAPDDGMTGPIRTVPGGLNFFRGDHSPVTVSLATVEGIVRSLIAGAPDEPPPADTARRRTKVEYPIQDVVSYIEKLAADWLVESGPRVTLRELEAGMEAFPGISTTNVRAAWKKANLPPAWRTPGRQ